VHLDLGGQRIDLSRRALVMGILNRTRDSFHDRGAYFRLDPFRRRAEELVAEGADMLDVGARPGGVDVYDVSETEETELAVGSIEEFRRRFDVPVSVDTQRASVAAAAFASGAVLGNDMSGFRDPGYLPAAASAGAAVIASTSGWRPVYRIPTRSTSMSSKMSPRRSRGWSSAGGRRASRTTGSCSIRDTTSARRGTRRCSSSRGRRASPVSVGRC
jgi:dihydropteroate synthase